MATRVGKVLLVLLLSPCVPPCHGLRKSKVNDALAASNRPPAGTETVINVDKIAKEIKDLGLDPKKLGKDAVKIWFALFRSGNITGDAVALAVFNTFGLAAAQIHPLLGVGFTLISKLFGVGTDPDAALVEMIMARVRIMIDQALATVNINFAEREFAGAMRTIRYGPNQPNHVVWYAERQADLLRSAPHLFPHCLSQSFTGSLESLENKANMSSDPCLNWQMYDRNGGLRALLLEIQWVNLHIQLAGVFATQKNVRAWNIARAEVQVLHGIIFRHFRFYREARGGTSSSSLGHAERGCTGYCIRQGKDTVLNKELKGPNCRGTPRRSGWSTYYPTGPPTSRVTYQYFGRRRTTQDRLAKEFRDCRSQHGDRIRARLNEDIEPMVSAISDWIRESARVRLT